MSQELPNTPQPIFADSTALPRLFAAQVIDFQGVRVVKTL
jgi:hypothetical protein